MPSLVQMTSSPRALLPFLLSMPQYLLAKPCKDPRHWLGHAVMNSTADYKKPAGRHVVAVLGSADPISVPNYGPAIAPIFDALKETSKLSFIAGGCVGLMGSPESFCKKGELGSNCNTYDGFWMLDECAPTTCEERGFKVNLVASSAIEEEIISGGPSVGMGDAFLVLPGGIGTTRELFDVLQANFEYKDVNKPVFAFNVGGEAGPHTGFYSGVVTWLSQLYQKKLLKAYEGSKGSSLFISSNATELGLAVDAWAASGALPEHLRFEQLVGLMV